MKRLDFLKGLLALPLALKGATLAGREPVRVPQLGAGYSTFEHDDHITQPVRDCIEWHSGGFRIQKARLVTLPQTGDAVKRRLEVWDHRGLVRARVFLLSGAVLAVADEAGYRSELAYQLAKRAIEIARDIAYQEWGDDWRLRIHKFQVENGLYG